MCFREERLSMVISQITRPPGQRIENNTLQSLQNEVNPHLNLNPKGTRRPGKKSYDPLNIILECRTKSLPSPGSPFIQLKGQSLTMNMKFSTDIVHKKSDQQHSLQPINKYHHRRYLLIDFRSSCDWAKISIFLNS